MRTEPCPPVNAWVAELDELLEVTEQCLGKVAQGALSWNEHSRIGRAHEVTAEAITAHLPIMAGKCSFHFSVSADQAACEMVARAVLMLEDDEAIPDDFDAGDALGELTNLVAGEIKKRLYERDRSVHIGIPVVLKGTIHCSRCSGQNMAASHYEIGPITVCVIVHLSSENNSDERNT